MDIILTEAAQSKRFKSLLEIQAGNVNTVFMFNTFIEMLISIMPHAGRMLGVLLVRGVRCNALLKDTLVQRGRHGHYEHQQ